MSVQERSRCLGVLVLTSLLAASPAWAVLTPGGFQDAPEQGRAGARPTLGSRPPFEPGTLIVRFRPARDVRRLRNRMRRALALSQVTSRFHVSSDRPLFSRQPLRRNRRSRLAREYSLYRVWRLSGSGQNVQRACRLLRRTLEVEYAEPNYRYELQALNDPYLSSSGSFGQSYQDLWGHHRIRAQQAWDRGVTGQGTVVAVVDTGLDYNHRDIAANVWVNAGEDINHNGAVDSSDFNGRDDDGNSYVDDIRGMDFAAAVFSDDLSQGLYVCPTGFLPDGSCHDTDPMDRYGHGTHVSGTIAASGNNAEGIAGVAYNTKIMPVKGFDDYGSGYTTDLIACITYAADNGAHVINNSWGGGGYSQALTDAINAALDSGSVVVASAGNDATSASFKRPANHPRAVTVSAFDQNDQVTYFSNFGPDVVDVTAPGGGSNSDEVYNILSLKAHEAVYAETAPELLVGQDYLVLAGTSMSAPHVSGVCALIQSVFRYSPELVRQILTASADDVAAPGLDGESGYGMVNAERAVDLALRLSIPRVAIVSPAMYAATDRGQAVTVSGTAEEAYVLEWGKGVLPSRWNLAASGAGAAGQRSLGTVAVPTDFHGGYLTIRLTASRFGYTFSDYVRVWVPDEQLKVGFQAALDSLATPQWGPYVADLEGDGLREILLGGSASGEVAEGVSVDGDSHLYVFESNGLLREGWPVVVPDTAVWDSGGTLTDGGIYAPPSVGDLDLDGLQEILIGVRRPISIPVSSWEVDRGVDRIIYRYSPDGELLPDPIMKTVMDDDDYFTHLTGSFTAIPADVDANGTQEVLASFLKSLEAMLANGTSLGGWPVQMTGHDRFWANQILPAVGDLDGDGRPEFVHVQEYEESQEDRLTLHAYRWDGTALPNFPVRLKGSRALIRSSPVLANVDGDALLELVVWSYDQPDPTSESIVPYLAVVNGDGTFVETDLPSFSARGLSAGDITGDGIAEIVIARERGRDLYAFDGQGEVLAGFPIRLPGHATGETILLADVDGDGVSDLVVPSGLDGGMSGGEQIAAYNGSGTLLAGFPLFVRDDISGIAVTDLDNNGRADIVALTRTLTPPGIAPADLAGRPYGLTAFELNVSLVAPAWPQIRHDARQTGAAVEDGSEGGGLVVLGPRSIHAGEELLLTVNAPQEGGPYQLSMVSGPSEARFTNLANGTAECRWTPDVWDRASNPWHFVFRAEGPGGVFETPVDVKVRLTNLALAGKAKASSSAAGTTPSLAIDGMADTAWVSLGGAEEWLNVKLAQSSDIYRVRVFLNGVAQSAASYDVQVKIRGFAWQSVGIWQDSTGTATDFEMLLPESLGRAVNRCRVIVRGATPAGIQEFKIRGAYSS